MTCRNKISCSLKGLNKKNLDHFRCDDSLRNVKSENATEDQILHEIYLQVLGQEPPCFNGRLALQIGCKPSSFNILSSPNLLLLFTWPSHYGFLASLGSNLVLVGEELILAVDLLLSVDLEEYQGFLRGPRRSSIERDMEYGLFFSCTYHYCFLCQLNHLQLSHIMK